jgi:hypothetical protein
MKTLITATMSLSAFLSGTFQSAGIIQELVDLLFSLTIFGYLTFDLQRSGKKA